MIPYALGAVILAQFDRIMISSYSGSSAAGLYSFAYNIGMLQMLIVGALNTAWMPRYFDYLNKKDFSSHDSETIQIFKIIGLES